MLYFFRVFFTRSQVLDLILNLYLYCLKLTCIFNLILINYIDTQGPTRAYALANQS